MDTISLEDRYSRQMLLPAIGAAGQRRLAAGAATVIGCGALGSTIATALARAGVGRLRLVDRDVVERHNLHRQILYDEADAQGGIPKALAAERHLRRVNSEIQIEGVVADVGPGNVEELVRGSQVIVDGLDNLETRYLLNDVAHRTGIPWIYGAVIAAQGMTMTILPGQTPCLRCLFPRIPPLEGRPTINTTGVVGPMPMTIGALESIEALKILLGDPERNPGLLTVDLWSFTFTLHRIGDHPASDCPACQGRLEFLDGPVAGHADP